MKQAWNAEESPFKGQEYDPVFVESIHKSE